MKSSRKADPHAAERRAFRAAVLNRDRLCQNCRMRSAVDPHHIIYEQELRNRGLPRWDPRCGMGLCRSCHDWHHSRARPIPLAKLSLDHILYAFEVLGPFAYDYLTRRYGGADPRLESRFAAAA